METWQKRLRQIAAGVLLLSLLASFFVAGKRIQAEAGYKQVGIAVDMNDIESFANARNISEGDVLTAMKNRGLTQVLFKEISLGTLETAGSLEILQGNRLMQSPDYPAVAGAIDISPAELYILIKDPDLADQIEAHVLAKIPGSLSYDTDPKVLSVPTMIPASNAEAATAKAAILDIGVGFDQERIQLVHDAGLGVIPQIRAWSAVDDESMALMKEDLRAMPAIALMMFNDKQLPGYPDKENLDMLEAALSDADGQPYAPLATIEFNDQKGLVGLANRFDKQVVRLHTISNPEMSRFEGEGSDEELQLGFKEALDRWELAVDERNMRCLLVRFFQIDTPYESYDFNLRYLQAISQDLENRGYTLSAEALLFPSLQAPVWLTALIGLGVAAGFYLFLSYLGLPRLAIAGALLATGLWLGLLFVTADLALKLMALAAVILFPTFSCVIFLDSEPLKLGPALGRFLAMCGVSLLGAVLMVGLLSNTSFVLKLDQFVGVKLAHAVPILLVPFILYIWKAPSPLKTLQGLWQKTIDYKWAIIFGVLGIAVMIYLGRTGNESTQVSDVEMIFRQFLSDALLVRPRSKEFLIGYPATILFLTHFAKNKGAWFLTVPAVIGQVSLVNTYAHLHTPLLVSLLRSVNGLWLGMVVGVLLVLLFRFVRAQWKKRFALQDPDGVDKKGASHA